MTIKTITAQDLYRHIKLGHQIVLLDIRSAEEYEYEHIDGASSFPLGSFQASNIIRIVCAHYPTPPTIYIVGASNADAETACQHLAKAAYEYIVQVEGGMHSWREQGLPIQTHKLPLVPLRSVPINQQIQIIMGGIVAVGTLMGTLLNGVFLTIPLLAGAGFAYEGIFGTDYLRQFLSKQSWNR